MKNGSMFKNLLWIDCSAGALVGILVLTFHSWLSELYGLPEGVLVFTGFANIMYASYSFSLAIRKMRTNTSLLVLIAANFAWAPVCIYLALTHLKSANMLGIGHLALEAFFVGGLAFMEWRFKDLLINHQINSSPQL